MIINLPLEEDFYKTASNNLNIVWDNIFEFVKWGQNSVSSNIVF